MSQSVPIEIGRWRHGVLEHTTDEVAAESPMEIRLGGVPLAVLMRTPGLDPDLVLGFCLTEAILLRPSEAASIDRIGEGEDARWEVRLADGVSVDPERYRRNAYTTSSCGVCGKASIDAVRIAAPPLPDEPFLSPEVVLSLPDRLAAAQPTFTATGGLHAAAAFNPAGELLAAAEDIGRHNAVDKLVGRLARGSWPITNTALVVSGRVSFEMVQKAAVAGIGVLCGVSAASSLAVELAQELGLTLVGFLRGDGFVVYARGDRVGAV